VGQKPIAFGELRKVGIVRDDNPGARSERSSCLRVNPMSEDHFVGNACKVGDFRGYWILWLVERRKDVRAGHIERPRLRIEGEAVPLGGGGLPETQLAGRPEREPDDPVEVGLVPVPADPDAGVVPGEGPAGYGYLGRRRLRPSRSATPANRGSARLDLPPKKWTGLSCF